MQQMLYRCRTQIQHLLLSEETSCSQCNYKKLGKIIMDTKHCSLQNAQEIPALLVFF